MELDIKPLLQNNSTLRLSCVGSSRSVDTTPFHPSPLRRVAETNSQIGQVLPRNVP
jgi:hypothetical protein